MTGVAGAPAHVNPYIKRRQRLNADPGYKIPYPHSSLEPILHETLGTIIFQDQVIEVAVAFAGFAGFGFPKAHAAAFGLLAYQSTWLRVHYGPELLCALLDEQPIGFYPPDALIHEAQRRGIEVIAPDLNGSDIGCRIDDQGAVRLGLRQVRGVRGEQLDRLLAERRRGGPFRSLDDLAARAGSAGGALELLAWAGACDRLAAAEQQRPGLARRAVLWRLGIGAPLAPAGQLSLAFELPPPALDPLTAWQTMLADYAATGLTTGSHPLQLMRPALLRRGARSSDQLELAPHRSRVSVGGLVVARQRPGTAGGVCFILLEDEHGTINLVLRPERYERFRLTVRTEPLVFAEGVLERHLSGGGTVNLLVDRIEPLEAGQISPAAVSELSGGDFRAVAPAVMSFAQGRRR